MVKQNIYNTSYNTDYLYIMFSRSSDSHIWKNILPTKVIHNVQVMGCEINNHKLALFILGSIYKYK